MTNIKLIYKTLLLMSFISILSISENIANAVEIDTKAKNAYILDYDTGAVLFEKNSQEKMPPASMSKLMTIYIVFEALRAGTINLDTTFIVSEKAWKKKGSKMFVEVGKSVSIMDLLKGIIIQSGNDACIVIAEGLSGNEDMFASQMNITAKQLGLNNSNFTNSTGWPDSEHYMSSRDLAELSRRLILDFPEYFYLFSEKTYTYSNIKQSNRNPLLFSYPLSDGLKTGYTEASGFGLTATALKGNKRLILVVNGLNSAKERKKESIRIFDWAFRSFININLFTSNEVVTQADVWLGEKDIVGLVSKESIKITLRKENLKNLTVKTVYESPIPSPIIKDKEYAKIIISDNATVIKEFPLYAKEDIKKAGPIKRIFSALSYIIFGAYAE